MSDVLVVALLSHDEARSLTDEVKQEGLVLREQLLRLYEGGAHVALGYGSWKDYWESEFDTGFRSGYYMLEAARVDRALHNCATEAISEGHARELAPILKAEGKGTVEEGSVVDAYTEAAKRAEESEQPLTAAIIKEVVAEYLPAKPKTAKLGKHHKKVKSAMDSLAEFAKEGRELTQEDFIMSGGNPNEKWLGQLVKARELLDSLIDWAGQARKGI